MNQQQRMNKETAISIMWQMFDESVAKGKDHKIMSQAIQYLTTLPEIVEAPNTTDESEKQQE